MKKIVFVLLIIFLITGCESKVYVNANPYYELLKDTDYLNTINMVEYSRYGKHLNLKLENINSTNELSLIIKSKDLELEYPLILKDNYLVTNNYINEGIELEKIDLGTYIVLVKEKIYENNEISYKYYHIVNNSKYGEFNYYTFTKDNTNNKVVMVNDKYQDYQFMKLEVFEEKMPDDYYDVIIDPGHGGIDSGAVNGKYQEDDFNLKYGLLVKERLEELGLKVKLTRESDTAIDTYGAGSRTGIPYETHAKLMFSLHLNSDSYKSSHGVEIYTAYNDDITFAKIIADNIVNYTSSDYSANKTHRVLDGVYTRTYSASDIKRNIKEAKKEGWTFYDIKPDSVTYYYFIRETGGMITNAFADGRNKKFKANIYYQENYGVEAYLLELAYISNKDDIRRLINEEDNYINAIVDSIKYYVQN